MNKAFGNGGWTPKARDFASTRRFLAKQQQANALQKTGKDKPSPPQANTPHS